MKWQMQASYPSEILKLNLKRQHPDAVNEFRHYNVLPKRLSRHLHPIQDIKHIIQDYYVVYT